MIPHSVKLVAGATLAGLVALGACVELRGNAAVLRLATARGATVDAASFDLFSGRVTWRGLAAEHGGVAVRVGSLSFTPRGSGLAALADLLVSPAAAFPMGEGEGPAQDSAGGAGEKSVGGAPGTATAKDVVITFDNVTYTIPKIELAGTRLGDGDLAAMLDASTSETIEARLRRLSAASITIPEIRADTSSGDFEQHWYQQQVLLANVVNGTAAIGSAGAGTLKTRGSKGTTLAEIGGLQMTGIDTGQIVHVAVTARSDDAEPLKPLAETFVASAVKVSPDGGAPVFTLAQFKEAGLKARPLALVSQARSVLLSEGKPGDPAVDAFLADVVSSVSFTLIEADDLATAPPQASEGAKEGLFRLARFAITGFGDRRVGGMSMSNILFEGPQGRLALAGAELKSLTIPAGAIGAAPPVVDGFELTGLSYDLDTANAGQPEQRVTFDLARASFAVPGANIDALPPKAAIAVEHFRMAVKKDAAPMLVTLGYPTLDVSSTLGSTYDPANQALKVDPWRLEGTGMGKLAMKLDLGKVTNAIISRDQPTQKAATAAVVFKGVDLVLHDDGLVDRLLAFKATQDGISVAQERDQIIDMVRTKLPAMAGDPPKLKPVEDAVARFIADPKIPLRLAVSTPDGLGAADAALLNDPDALLARLSISASNTD